MSQEKEIKQFDWKYVLTTIITIVAIIIPIIVGSCSINKSDTLRYNIQVQIDENETEVIRTKVEIIVSNGGIGDITFINYRNGKVQKSDKNILGEITKNSSTKERTFEFEMGEEEEGLREYLVSQYVLINGLDGTKKLDLILYHVNEMDNEDRQIKAMCYTTQDLALNEISEENQLYKRAFQDYQELKNYLKEMGEL